MLDFVVVVVVVVVDPVVVVVDVVDSVVVDSVLDEVDVDGYLEIKFKDRNQVDDKNTWGLGGGLLSFPSSFVYKSNSLLQL